MFTQMLPHRIQSFLSSPEHDRGVPLPDVSNLAQLLPGEESLRPPILTALEALEAFPYISDLLATFPPHISYAIKASLLAPDRYQYARLQVLEKLVNKRCYMREVVDLMRPSPLCLLEHTCVFGMIEGMLTDLSKYRCELAFLFVQLPLCRLPRPLQQKIAIASTLPLKVFPAYGYWSLCSDAEGRLLKAMHEQAVLLVNDVILLKFYGKLSGVALQNALLADGTLLLAGCWYAPVDHRDEIRDAFDRGESHLYVEGQWTFIREVKESEEETLLHRAQTFASSLPAQLPPQIASYSSRAAYRYSEHEDL